MLMDKNSLDSEIEALMKDALDEKDEIEKEELTDDKPDEDDNKPDVKDEEYDDDLKDDNLDDELDDESNKIDDEKKDPVEDEDKKQSPDTAKFTPLEVTVNGQKVMLESQEEVKDFINTKNRNTLPKENVTEEIVKQAKLSQEDLALFADIKTGDVGAFAKLAKDLGIDLAEVDEFDGKYEQKFKPNIKTDFDRVIDSIGNDAELAPKFNEVTKDLPDDFLHSVSQNPNDLAQFASHIKSGLAQELLELAVKDTALGKGTLIENYIKHGEAKAGKKAEAKPAKKEERKLSEKEIKLRKRANADNEQNKGGKTADLSVDDIWDDPEIMKKIASGEINLADLDD